MTTTRLGLIAAAVLASLAAGCASVESTGAGESRPVVFSASDFAWSQAAGRNTLQGRVAYRDWTCGGGPVGLTPDTPYSRSRVARLYGSTTSAALPVETVRSRQVGEAGDDYSAFVRTTRCDANGAFRFENLPDGSWFVIGRARPRAGGEGVALMKRVQTRGGRVAVVQLP
jgi:hypothetical protein